MFIVNPNKGGYQGDVVNSGFRKGRQDAYRDYIDNYNFALQADAANNAENQLNVERAAKNYGLDNKMRQDARTEAINFVNDTSKLDDAIVGNEMNRNKNDYLWANAEQLGKSAGVTFAATQSAQEGKSRTDAAVQQDMANNPQFAIDANRANLEQPGLKNEQIKANTGHIRANTAYTETNTETAKDANEARRTMADLVKQQGDVQNKLIELGNISDEEWQNRAMQGRLQQLREQGDTRSETEIMDEMRKNPQVLAQMGQALKADQIAPYQQQLRQIETDYNAAAASASGGKGSGRTSSNSGNDGKQQGVKVTQVKLNPDADPRQVLEGLPGVAVKDADGRTMAKIVGNTLQTGSQLYEFAPGTSEEEMLRLAGMAGAVVGNEKQNNGNGSNANASGDLMGN